MPIRSLTWRKKETLPEVDTVTRLALGDSLDVTWSETSRGINPDQHWYDTATGEPLTDADVEDLITTAKGISWDTPGGHFRHGGRPEHLWTDGCRGQAAGFNRYTYSALTLLLGNEDENGDIYARLPDSSMVYTVASEDVSSLMSASLDTLWSKTLLSLPYDQLQEAVFTTSTTSRVLHPQAGEDATADDAASSDTEALATATDAATDEETEETVDPDEELWNSLTALQATDRLTSGTLGNTVLSVQVTDVNGLTVTLVFSEYDVDSYVATMDGRSLLVSADEVDKLVRTVKQGA